MKCTESDIVGIKSCSVPNIKSTIEQSSKNPGKTMYGNKERGNGTIQKTTKKQQKKTDARGYKYTEGNEGGENRKETKHS